MGARNPITSTQFNPFAQREDKTSKVPLKPRIKNIQDVAWVTIETASDVSPNQGMHCRLMAAIAKVNKPTPRHFRVKGNDEDFRASGR